MTQTQDQLAKYIREKDVEIDIDKVVGNHKTAEINPMMTAEELEALRLSIEKSGQKMNLLLMEVYPKGTDGKHYLVIDGRNRIECFKKLGAAKFIATTVGTLTPSDLLEEYIESIHTRRNLTSDQKTVMAVREYIKMKNSGQKVKQEQVAKKHGITKPTLSKGLVIYKKMGSEPLDRIFNNKTFKPLGSDKVYKTLRQIYNDIKAEDKKEKEDSLDAYIAKVIEKNGIKMDDNTSKVMDIMLKQEELISTLTGDEKSIYFKLIRTDKRIREALLISYQNQESESIHINQLNKG